MEDVLSSEDQRMEDYSSDIDEEYDHDHADDDEEEESGWTSCLIDFEIMNQRERELKEEKTEGEVGGGGSSYRHSVVPVPLPRKLKTIKKKLVYDFEDPFEDTATSPHSSPKVSTLMIDDDEMDSMMLQTKMKKGISKNDKTSGSSPLGKGDRWYFHDQDQEMRSATHAAGKEGIRGIIDEEMSCDNIDDCCAHQYQTEN